MATYPETGPILLGSIPIGDVKPTIFLIPTPLELSSSNQTLVCWKITHSLISLDDFPSKPR